MLCLLLVALIGWLVGWLLARLHKSRPVESPDAELAGKLHLFDDECLRLRVENADLKSRITFLESAIRARETFSTQAGDSGDLSSAFAAIGERNRLREELSELKEKLEGYELMMKNAQGVDNGVAGELWYDAARGLVKEIQHKVRNQT